MQDSETDESWLDRLFRGDDQAIAQLVDGDHEAWHALAGWLDSESSPEDRAVPAASAALLEHEPSLEKWKKVAYEQIGQDFGVLRRIMSGLRSWLIAGAEGGATCAQRYERFVNAVCDEPLGRIREILRDVAVQEPDTVLHGKTLLLVAKESVRAEKYEQGLNAAREAAEVLGPLEQPELFGFARRVEAGALLGLGEVPSALAIAAEGIACPKPPGLKTWFKSTHSSSGWDAAVKSATSALECVSESNLRDWASSLGKLAEAAAPEHEDLLWRKFNALLHAVSEADDPEFQVGVIQEALSNSGAVRATQRASWVLRSLRSDGSLTLKERWREFRPRFKREGAEVTEEFFELFDDVEHVRGEPGATISQELLHLLREAGDPRAADVQRRICDATRDYWGEDPSTFDQENELARIFLEQQRFEEARSHLQDLLDRQIACDAVDAPWTLRETRALLQSMSD